MKDYPQQLQFHSEALEPTFQHLIGKWYARSQHMKQTQGAQSAAYVDSLEEWWWGMKSLSRLMIVCPEATHATIALQNHMHEIKRLIEHEIGIEISFMESDTNAPSFRNRVKFDLVFHF